MSLLLPIAAPKRAADGSTLLACNEDGVWRWPGVALSERVGRGIVPLSKDRVAWHVTKFYGHQAHHSGLTRAIELAAAAISVGDLPAAAAALAKSRLPWVSRDGAALLKAIGGRLGIPAPEVDVADGPRLWTASDVSTFAALYDRHAGQAQLLKGIFCAASRVPGLAKSNDNHLPGGQPDGGQYCSAADTPWAGADQP